MKKQMKFNGKEHYYTTEQVAEMLQMSPNTIRLYAISGAMPAYRIGDKVYRFREKDLLEWVKSSKVTPQNK